MAAVSKSVSNKPLPDHGQDSELARPEVGALGGNRTLNLLIL
jgi:hypothetical protein